jgi:uncharacterized coiled-coil protein SlyX
MFLNITITFPALLFPADHCITTSLPLLRHIIKAPKSGKELVKEITTGGIRSATGSTDKEDAASVEELRRLRSEHRRLADIITAQEETICELREKICEQREEICEQRATIAKLRKAAKKTPKTTKLPERNSRFGMGVVNAMDGTQFTFDLHDWLVGSIAFGADGL